MATTPAPNLESQLAQHLSDLGHRHATVSYALIAALGLVLAVMCAGGYFSLKAYNAQLARQDAKDSQYNQDRKAWQDTLAQHDTERASQALQIAQLEAQIAQRDQKPLPPAIKAGLQPNASVKDAALAVSEAYSSFPDFGVAQSAPDGQNVLLSLWQAQDVVIAKLAGDKATADLKDTQAIVVLQSQTIGTLNSDVKQCKDLNVQAQKDIDGYKNLAKKTRWQKLWSGAKTGALIVVSAYVGHKL